MTPTPWPTPASAPRREYQPNDDDLRELDEWLAECLECEVADLFDRPWRAYDCQR